jgi:8-oxo-dGTP pyrophosphatase MutT (NUDIX family)
MSNGDTAVFQRLGSGLPEIAPLWSGDGLQAAVLVALTEESVPRVILGRRAQHLRLHPGEIAFPGGKREPEDESHWSTAVREAHEEIGLQPVLVRQLGEMPALLTRSDFQVHPCVAAVPSQFNMVVDPTEMESAFLVPLRDFARKENYRLEKMTDERGTRMVPHYKMGKDNIWGVTATVLVQLVNLAFDAGLNLEQNRRIQP